MDKAYLTDDTQRVCDSWRWGFTHSLTHSGDRLINLSHSLKFCYN
ncbi:hypothetical protein NSP_21630 [Nodularia spumigena CCY9414]|nr:hypothetical protein NSP_21630 [Nodularia spumigena CCY9414]